MPARPIGHRSKAQPIRTPRVQQVETQKPEAKPAKKPVTKKSGDKAPAEKEK